MIVAGPLLDPVGPGLQVLLQRVVGRGRQAVAIPARCLDFVVLLSPRAGKPTWRAPSSPPPSSSRCSPRPRRRARPRCGCGAPRSPARCGCPAPASACPSSCGSARSRTPPTCGWPSSPGSRSPARGCRGCGRATCASPPTSSSTTASTPPAPSTSPTPRSAARCGCRPDGCAGRAGAVADRIVVEGTCYARRLRADDEVRLPGARITGNLDLAGAELTLPDRRRARPHRRHRRRQPARRAARRPGRPSPHAGGCGSPAPASAATWCSPGAEIASTTIPDPAEDAPEGSRAPRAARRDRRPGGVPGGRPHARRGQPGARRRPAHHRHAPAAQRGDRRVPAAVRVRSSRPSAGSRCWPTGWRSAATSRAATPAAAPSPAPARCGWSTRPCAAPRASRAPAWPRRTATRCSPTGCTSAASSTCAACGARARCGCRTWRSAPRWTAPAPR